MHRQGWQPEHQYDAKGRVTQTTHPDGNITRSVYNAIDKVEQDIDALGRITRFDYNERGEQTAVVHADGSREETSFDPEGNVTAQTDRAGRVTKMRYDAANHLVETIHPDATPDDDSDNPRTRHEYDAVGRKTTDIDEMRRIVRYAYDALGRLTAVVLPRPDTGNNPPFVDGQPPTNAGTLITRYSHDEQGNKLEQIDALGRVTQTG